MRIPGPRRRAPLVLLATAGFALAGCTTAPPAPSISPPAPTTTPSPVFTSGDDALASVVETYKKFERASDDIARDGGANPERIKPYVNAAGYAHVLESAARLKSEGSHGVGYTVLNNAVLQSYEERSGTATVSMYVCEDISRVDRVDANGHSLIEPGRGDYYDYEVVLTGRTRTGLVIQQNKAWTQGGICKF